MANENITYVDNTFGEATSGVFFKVIRDAYETGVLADDYKDIFSIEILEGYNDDGTNRMIIGWA